MSETRFFNTKREIAKERADLLSQIAFLDSLDTSCGTCDAFTGRGCKRAGGQEPPPEVKAEGCDEYFWNEVPF